MRRSIDEKKDIKRETKNRKKPDKFTNLCKYEILYLVNYYK